MIKSYWQKNNIRKKNKPTYKNLILLSSGVFLSILFIFFSYMLYSKIIGKKPTGKVLGTSTFLPVIADKIPPMPQISANPPQIWAKSAILVDSDTFYPIYQKNINEPLAIASITKIMNAIIVFENYKLDDVATISKNAASTIGSDIQLRTGEQLTIESLLFALLINSANDAGVALTEQMGTDKFVNLMNQKAKDMGLVNTYFKDATGLSEENKSTAFDLAVIARYALKNPDFLKIINIPEFTIMSVDQKWSHELKNSNRLIQPDEKYYIPQVVGGKTGFTNEAGHCLLSIGKKDDHYLISVILGTSENTITASANESYKLWQWAIENIKWN